MAQSAGADLISPAFFNGTRMLLGSLLLSPLAVYRMRRCVSASSRRTLLLGGAVALYDAGRGLGQEVRVLCAGALPKEYDYLYGE